MSQYESTNLVMRAAPIHSYCSTALRECECQALQENSTVYRITALTFIFWSSQPWLLCSISSVYLKASDYRILHKDDQIQNERCCEDIMCWIVSLNTSESTFNERKYPLCGHYKFVQCFLQTVIHLIRITQQWTVCGHAASHTVWIVMTRYESRFGHMQVEHVFTLTVLFPEWAKTMKSRG